ncbi:hypothetical protein HDU98_011475, partial [Podochytrium sp. JEL0797]
MQLQQPQQQSVQAKFAALLSKVPKDKLHLAEALISRLKSKQITIQQFAEAVKSLLNQTPQQLQQQQHQQQQSLQQNPSSAASASIPSPIPIPGTIMGIHGPAGSQPPRIQLQQTHVQHQHQPSMTSLLHNTEDLNASAAAAASSGSKKGPKKKVTMASRGDDDDGDNSEDEDGEAPGGGGPGNSTSKSGNKNDSSSSGGGGGKFDIGREFDVTMGVNMREEEDLLSLPATSRLHQSQRPSNPLGFDRSRLQTLVNTDTLRTLVSRAILASSTTTSTTPTTPDLQIGSGTLEYMSLALHSRLLTFLETSIKVAKHRTGIHQHTFLQSLTQDAASAAAESSTPPTTTTPPNPNDSSSATLPASTKKRPKTYVDVQLLGPDTKTILQALEKSEKAAETREKTSLHPDGRAKSAAETRGDLDAGVLPVDEVDEFGASSAAGKKRKKKEKEAAAAAAGGGGKKDVSEIVKVKSTNSTAMKAAGKKGMKSWMTGVGGA